MVYNTLAVVTKMKADRENPAAMVRGGAAMAVICAMAAAAQGVGAVAAATRTCPGATKVCLAAVQIL